MKLIFLTFIFVALAIDQSVATNLGSEQCTCEEAIEKLENFEHELKMTIAEMKGLCHVKYENKCFTIIAAGRLINHAYAESKCKEIGAKLGNIYSAQHYDAILKYVRRQEEDINVWLGMSVEPYWAEVFLTNGSSAPYVLWRTGWPGHQSERIRMALAIRMDLQALNEGMFSAFDYDHTSGGLCEI